jgi:hypothetical protein
VFTDYWRPKIVSAKVIREAESLPKGYGVAWYLPYSDAAYCLPVPLNRIVGAFRAWWLEWRLPAEDDPITAAYAYGLSKGREQGRREGEASTHRLYAEIRRELRDALAEARKR